MNHRCVKRCATSRACICILLIAGAVATPRALADPPVLPLPVPQYSFDSASPSVVQGIVMPGDVLELAFPHPVIGLPGPLLGLIPIDDVDGLSDGNVDVSPESSLALLFSVDAQTTGLSAPDFRLVAAGVPYNTNDQSDRNQAAGDQFLGTELFGFNGLLGVSLAGVPQNNVLVRNNFDEGGTDFSAYPATHAYTLVDAGVDLDRLDATARLAVNPDNGSYRAVYYTLTADSPSLPVLSQNELPSGAHVFVFGELVPLYGACCVDDGSCTLTLLEGCNDGLWLGPGTTCDMCPPPEEGACCLPGACDILDADSCIGLGGSWLGPGTSCLECNQLPDDLGTCCLPGGECTVQTILDCTLSGGRWIGPDLPCDICDTFPPEPGACCLNDGTCQILPEDDCSALWGTWMGPATTCDHCGGPAMENGACCYSDGGCAITDPNTCFDAFGFWLGPDTTCDMCEPPAGTFGACCLPDGNCVMADAATCATQGGELHSNAPCLGDGDGDGVDEMCVDPLTPTPWRFYATCSELGLVPEDDIDALLVFDRNDNSVFDATDLVLFSLTPDSPSLATIPGASPQGSAADIFVARVGTPVALLLAAADVGLGAAGDNIDALDFLAVETRTDPTQHAIRASSDLDDKVKDKGGVIQPARRPGFSTAPRFSRRATEP